MKTIVQWKLCGILHKKKISSQINIMTLFEKIFYGISVLIHFVYISLYIGIIQYKPKWILLYQHYIKLAIGIILIILFIPFRMFREKGSKLLYKYIGITTPLVHSFVFSSGLILLYSFFMDSNQQIQ